jgi:8-oxo-dGTP pyrophosphatase MutT (NUDIX family)
MGAGFLPVAIHNGKLYFLFGKENKYADTPGFADFGGGTDNKEPFLETALREFTEETTGFFGSIASLRQYVKQKGFYPIDYVPQTKRYRTYRTHLLPMEYNPQVVFYYNNNQRFLQKHLPKAVYKKEKFFEKSEMRWFSFEELEASKPLFRPYYRDIIQLIVEQIDRIEPFVRSRLE